MSSAKGVRLKHASPRELKGSLSRRYTSRRNATARTPELSSMPRVSSWQTITPPPPQHGASRGDTSAGGRHGAGPSSAAAEGADDGDGAEPDVAARRQAALLMMHEMGFVDEALNSDVLAACGYNAERAVSLLLGDEQMDVRETDEPTPENSHFKKALQSLMQGERHFSL